MKNTYFLIPTYNEERMIAHVLQNLMDNGHRNIVVVNDGSSDQSAAVVRRFPNVILINHPINRGQGVALATGLDYLSQITDCDYIVTFDADNQHCLNDAEGMVSLLQHNDTLDIVLGSRFIQKNHEKIPPLRRITLKLGTIFLRFIYGLNISDAHNGLRAMRRSVATKMTPKLNDFTHASEMIFLIKMHKLQYQEYPTNIIYSDYSLSKGQSTSNLFHIALQTMLHKINMLIFKA